MDVFTSKMLARLYASAFQSPAMNCRPGKSRQRLDLRDFATFIKPGALAARLLQGESVKLVVSKGEAGDILVDRLTAITKDAATYSRETGIDSLFLGVPVLSVPAEAGFDGRKLMAPLAFLPISVKVSTLLQTTVEIEVTGAVVPNAALIHWVERQVGHTLELPSEMGTPLAYVATLSTVIGTALGLTDNPTSYSTLCAGLEDLTETSSLVRVVQAAILGLFPLPSVNITNDLEAIAAGERSGALDGFLMGSLGTDNLMVGGTESDRLVTIADPSQAQAVRLSRLARGLVIHGPPGTGKSATIVNVIGNHLARGKKVLFVCEKRTAIEVVRNRLDALGLGHLLAVVHDPQRDQKDLYLSVRSQVDGVLDLAPDASVVSKLDAVDEEISQIHDELSSYALAMHKAGEEEASFANLLEEWLSLNPEHTLTTDARLADFDKARTKAQEILDRGEQVDYKANPWRGLVDVATTYFSKPHDAWKVQLEQLIRLAHEVDDKAFEVRPTDMTVAMIARERAAKLELAYFSKPSTFVEFLKRLMLVLYFTFTTKKAERTQESIQALRLAADQNDLLLSLSETVKAFPLLNEKARAHLLTQIRDGQSITASLMPLLKFLPTVRNLLRIDDLLNETPVSLATDVFTLVGLGIKATVGLPALRKAVLTSEIQARLHESPVLLAMDAHRLKALQDRFTTIQSYRYGLVKSAAVAYWEGQQQGSLVAATGTRLNTAGAELKRRLLVKGQKAMKLREVIEVGQDIEGGDPLFSLRPVWMCSPEAVAQIFPRKALFDLVIFDEASQLKLEASLPCLMRAERVVIAGDPHQLPPTRFFESAAQETAESDDLFAEQQADQEDLLSAALNIEIDQTYLDVHYRSVHPELIAFSNAHFYGGRLQAIPSHPQIRRNLPIQLFKVGGTYSKRTNLIEAQAVVAQVESLLNQDNPPSIGVASFNAPQRDLIDTLLAEKAAEDAAFASKLETARNRVNPDGSFAGLFTKNLENVQGDERDVILISTTFGKDEQGKFKKQFGPLMLTGGGRRLNVLVTRAREHVIVFTSIPETEYLDLAAKPANPNGAWLLFDYLRSAHKLAVTFSKGMANLKALGSVRVLNSASALHESLGRQLASQYDVGVDVGVGSAAFRVDIVMYDGNMTGILCDIGTFGSDSVEWDNFRRGVLARQGWTLKNLCTPHYFRTGALEDGAVSEAA